ncbi:hypothetical protein [Lentzea jiangxiensis]|uniref:Rv3660c-like CheY-like N-terminal domain-containing protein n=1 Tax=Lentzea jiangxiensis TaxID=641025 RepID=A0A1H0X4B2_9PSEU|nr:hypothetical protein [Lentzea jiangxiensis]SDP97787.1 hypothetical protein SAMN05421507_1344 [Lentzea jiangxiensis]
MEADAPPVRTWLDARRVVLDEVALTACLQHRLPLRSNVVLVTASAAKRTPWVEAVRMGVEQIYDLPIAAAALAVKIRGAEHALIIVGTKRLSGHL